MEATFYIIKSKEGRVRRKGTMGNPQWTNTLCTLCLFDDRKKAEQALDDLTKYPLDIYSNPNQANTEPTIVPVTISVD